jgi:hypothetical protein
VRLNGSSGRDWSSNFGHSTSSKEHHRSPCCLRKREIVSLWLRQSKTETVIPLLEFNSSSSYRLPSVKTKQNSNFSYSTGKSLTKKKKRIKMPGFKYLEMVGLVIVSSWIWGAPSVGKSPIAYSLLVLCAGYRLIERVFVL